MPSICRNVNQRNPLNRVPGEPNVGNIGDLDVGQTPGNLPYLILTYDTNGDNAQIRGDEACPSSWSRNHNCPEVDQPPVIPAGSTWTDGSWPGRRWNPGNHVQGTAGFNQIANQAGNGPSGMFWSCDEWPARHFAQGGSGASTYCAPMSTSCVRNLGNGVNSEQNIQGNIHLNLRNHLGPGGSGPVAGRTSYQFYFMTMWNDDRDAISAAVQWIDNSGGEFLVGGAYKRSLESSMVYSDVIFPDGTGMSFMRSITTDEAQQHSDTVIRARSDANSSLAIIASSELDETGPLLPINSGSGKNFTGAHVAHQVFESLATAPILNIIDIGRVFIERLARSPQHPYVEQALNVLSIPLSSSSSGPAIASPTQSLSDRDVAVSGSSASVPINAVQRRQQKNECGPGNPCADASCCSNNGICGFGPEHCGKGNCTNNCDATAMCGRYSAGGNISCALSICCSYYGWCGVGDQYCSSPDPEAPCQEEFGSCEVIPAPSCAGSSALGRSVAYYQVSNAYTRQCERITPTQINSTGLTHLNLAFASIDPSTFRVVPADDRDVALYKTFTALKSSTLQTWIAIGGWDFNDPGPTRTTFSNLAASPAHRATFISSIIAFMSQYGFQGVDIDWEYPGDSTRGGTPADTKNFVELLREMRAAFGTRYGLSIALSASYWYMRWFDPSAIQPYVDFFGLMTYDFHGPWDAHSKEVGPVMIGQTNIPEIYNWTLPLWYDKIDPAKLNLGLAYYGRGYTVSSTDCTTVGCEWSGLSNPGPCTNFAGVMSLEEIETNLIPSLGIDPILDSDAMMKYLVWGNQWLGYDDLETIAMKKDWASSHCFGGTMIWSIDFYSGPGSGTTPDGGGSIGNPDPGAGGGQGSGGGSGSDSVVYIDPSIWREPHPQISCEPPCTFILPPLQLSTETTITFPPYITSLDVAWSNSAGWTHITETTTLTIPPVTTTEIVFWEHVVTGSNTATSAILTFLPTSSILPPPFTITNDRNPQSESGVTHPVVVRTITPPPYPYTEPTNTQTGPPSSSSSSTAGVIAVIPRVTVKPGPPGPICKSGCGKLCEVFCETPCLLDCDDGGDDFKDPSDPHPPKRPTPTEENDSFPTPNVSPQPDPSDPQGDEPQNEEEEEEDDECAFEFHLPPPVYIDPNAGATGGQTISPPQPPPTPQPPPNPTPPSPNPATESLHCLEGQNPLNRASMIDAVNSFCNEFNGFVLDASDTHANPQLAIDHRESECPYQTPDCHRYQYHVTVGVKVLNWCRFTVDGPFPNQECGRILREAIDQCDTDSTMYKKGGSVTSNCAEWFIFPVYEPA